MIDNPVIGLAGCGRWGRHILRDLRSLGCVVDVADPDPAAQKIALDGGARKTADHIDSFGGSYDGFVIAAWTTVHASLIGRLAKKHKPIFCEKPLTSDPKQLNGVINQTLSPVFVMHKWRYHHGVQALAGIAQSGEYGKVNQIVTRRLQWTTPHGDVDAVWSLAPHDLSILYGVLGYLPQPRSAIAVADKNGNARSIIGILGDKTETNALVHVAANWVSVERSVTVILDNAVVVLDDPLADHIKLYPGCGHQALAKSAANAVKISVSTEYPLLVELRVFIEYLAGGPPPMTDAAEGVLIVQTLARLRKLAGLKD